MRVNSFVHLKIQFKKINFKNVQIFDIYSLTFFYSILIFIIIWQLRILHRPTRSHVNFERKFRFRKRPCVNNGTIMMLRMKRVTWISNDHQIR